MLANLVSWDQINLLFFIKLNISKPTNALFSFPQTQLVMNSITRRSSVDYEDFLFKEDEKTILKLRLNYNLQTARIETEKEKRVFIIEDEGLLRTRLVLKNEYGVRMGQMIFDNRNELHGTVEIENSRFKFTIPRGSSAGLSIYNNSGRNLIYNCNLSFEPGENKPETREVHQPALKNSPTYILALSWYLFQLSIKQKEPELSL